MNLFRFGGRRQEEQTIFAFGKMQYIHLSDDGQAGCAFDDDGRRCENIHRQAELSNSHIIMNEIAGRRQLLKCTQIAVT